jgi:hypothetical protein
VQLVVVSAGVIFGAIAALFLHEHGVQISFVNGTIRSPSDGAEILNEALASASAPAVPVVSFIIPTSGRATLSRTLDSLVAMRRSDMWEAVVVVDGASAAVGESVRARMANDTRFRVLDLEQSVGDGGRPKGKHGTAGMVRNVGMALATGMVRCCVA